MPAEGPPGDLGKKLREARERRGLSLRHIANSTKIAVSILDALERNDISRLPGGIFGRSFVRSFATEVGLGSSGSMTRILCVMASPSCWRSLAQERGVGPVSEVRESSPTFG